MEKYIFMQLNIGDARIILLCNSLIAVPAMQELLFYQRISAIVVPARNKEVTEVVKKLVEGSSVELVTVNRKDFTQKIKKIIAAHKPVAALMMTFPYMIPEEIIALPPKGFINFHYGKLPEYRGPEPIFTQIIKQEREPGLTVHVVTSGIDDGPVILQETVVYNENDTYGILQHKLADAGAKQVNLLMKILSFGNRVPSLPQDESKAGYHKKPMEKDLMINWQTMDSTAIKALIHACNPWNKGAGTRVNDWLIGITDAELAGEADTDNVIPGTIITCNKEEGLLVRTIHNKKIKINIIYTNEGFFPGSRLSDFGIKAGMEFR